MWTTKRALLEKIKGRDEVSWREFYMLYKPFIFRIGKNHHLSDDDCEELIQRSMMAMFHRAQTFCYDPQKGHFRGYLAHLVRNQLVDILRESKRQNHTVPLEDCDSEQELIHYDNEFDSSYRQLILSMALDELRQAVASNVYEAFQLFAIQGKDADAVAEALNISKSAVYVYKKRCHDKLQRILGRLEEMDREEKNQSITGFKDAF